MMNHKKLGQPNEYEYINKQRVNMSKNFITRLLHELIVLIFILLIGALFIYDPSGTKNFNYPLAMRPEWRERFQILGWGIVYGGYPVRVIVKLLIRIKKR